MRRFRCRFCGVSVSTSDDGAERSCMVCQANGLLSTFASAKTDGLVQTGMPPGCTIVWLPDVPTVKLAILCSTLVPILTERAPARDTLAGARSVANDILSRDAGPALEALVSGGLPPEEAEAIRSGLRAVALPYDMTGFPAAPRQPVTERVRSDAPPTMVDRAEATASPPPDESGLLADPALDDDHVMEMLANLEFHDATTKLDDADVAAVGGGDAPRSPVADDAGKDPVIASLVSKGASDDEIRRAIADRYVTGNGDA